MSWLDARSNFDDWNTPFASQLGDAADEIETLRDSIQARINAVEADVRPMLYELEESRKARYSEGWFGGDTTDLFGNEVYPTPGGQTPRQRAILTGIWAAMNRLPSKTEFFAKALPLVGKKYAYELSASDPLDIKVLAVATAIGNEIDGLQQVLNNWGYYDRDVREGDFTSPGDKPPFEFDWKTIALIGLGILAFGAIRK